ncbi:MAG: hypothetical protein JWN40_4996 [Phycisphaerales bacterium]|nr:hypothetical protein [Phycisphaerales bacterium]
MRHLWVLVAVLGFCGCGPLMGPMTVRLKEDQQKVIDGMWNNMLTPADRLDRELLLDVVCEYWLFQLGVDRLHMVAEKQYERGRVVMEIDCDGRSPGSDQFTVTLLDERGRTVRRERYGREEIEARTTPVTEEEAKRATELSEEDKARQAERRARILAATQPAVVR